MFRLQVTIIRQIFQYMDMTCSVPQYGIPYNSQHDNPLKYRYYYTNSTLYEQPDCLQPTTDTSFQITAQNTTKTHKRRKRCVLQ